MAGKPAAPCHGDHPLIYCDTSKLPERRPYDHYSTPPEAVEKILDWYRDHEALTPRTILDLGAGNGVWGQAASQRWPNAVITGLEIRPLPRPPAYDHWITGDLTDRQLDSSFDLVLGNPPYRHATAAVNLALASLTMHGSALLLLRLAFLAGQRRAQTIYADGNLKAVVVCSRRLSFNTDGTKTTGTEDHAHFLFQRHSLRPPSVHFLL